MKRIFITLLLFSMAAVSIAAQDNSIVQPKDSTVWTLQDCITYAMKNNISLQQSRNNYLSGLEDTEQAKAAMLPTLSASASEGLTNRPFTENNSNVVGSQVYSNSKKTSYSGNYGLNSSITLFQGGSLRTALKQQRVQNDIDSLTIRQNMNDLLISIVEAYMQCLYSREAITVAKSNAEASKAQRDRGVEFKQSGELSKVDVAELESQYASDQHQIITAQTNYDNNLLQLKQLLELGINDEIALSQTDEDESEILRLLPAKQDVYANALDAMPEIKIANLNELSADLSVKQAKTGYSPTLSASASIGSTHVSGAGKAFSGQIKNNLNESLGLSLTIPIFQGRRNKTAVNKAKIAADNAALSRLSSEKAILKDVESTYLDAVSYQSQYLSAKEKEKYAQESYNLVSESFSVGKRNTVELLSAQNSLLAAKEELLQTKYMTLLSMAVLDIYQGNYEKYQSVN